MNASGIGLISNYEYTENIRKMKIVVSKIVVYVHSTSAEANETNYIAEEDFIPNDQVNLISSMIN